MSWLEALMSCRDKEYGLTGYRLFHPFQDMTVWIFRSIDDAKKGVARFYKRCALERPWFVPLHFWLLTDISIFQLFNDQAILALIPGSL